MAYICTPREVAGLRGIRKKTICRLHPSWLNASGGFVSEDWESDYDQGDRHYSTIDDADNGNVLPHVNGRPYFHISSNCSLPLDSGPNPRAILLQHKANLGFTHSTIGCTIFGSNPTVTSTPTGYIEEVTVRLGFYTQNLFSEMQVLRRDKPWLKVVGEYDVVKFKQRYEITCTNVALVGTLDPYGNMIHPTYSTQTTTLVDETTTHTITMTSFSEEFRTHSLDFNTSQNDATYTNEFGQVITYQTYSMSESGTCYSTIPTIYATKL
jgi:hypothetical protein